MLPSLENLRCFDAAARLLRFRAAARTVALTPAAFGQRIKQLEDELGVRLFERTTRRVKLTGAGLALLPHARACLEAAAACVRAARGEVGPAPVEIVMGTRHELGLSWLTPNLEVMAREHPSVTVHLYFGSGPDLLLRVRTLEIDCAVTSARLTDPGLDALQLHPEEYVFVGAPALLKKRPLRRAEDANGHTLVDAGPDLPLYAYWRDSPAGGDRLHFARVLRVGTIAAIHQMVLAQRGVAVLPRYLVRQDVSRGRLRRVFPEVVANHDYFRLVFRREDPRRSVFEALAATLRKQPLS